MLLKPKRALLSLSDKTELLPLARFLHEQGVQLLSTGGTFKAIAQDWMPVQKVADYTGQEEILGGRVKTLHPKVFGGILGDVAQGQREEMQRHGIDPIDLVVVNLYPFRETLAAKKQTDAQAQREIIEQIDIGGPSMLRAAAKNYHNVCVLCDPQDYQDFIAAWREQGGISLERRQAWAAKAFAHTARYDADISQWYLSQSNHQERPWPAELSCAGKLQDVLRYGENPHQRAAWYVSSGQGLGGAVLVQGKPLSYNNLNDADAAIKLVASLPDCACAIIKHANPCGVAVGDTAEQAYERALECDSLSAFGGIVALNRPLDEPTAQKIISLFTEVVIAPEITEQAKSVFLSKPNLRLLEVKDWQGLDQGMAFKSISGGFLVQDQDRLSLDYKAWNCATIVAPSSEQLRDLQLAWAVVKAVKSNAIVLVKDGACVGIGAGQMSRVAAAVLACEQAGSKAQGAVCASDAFFPFQDALAVVVEAGASAVVQPGGAKNDAQVIAYADEQQIAMMLTGQRHFAH